MQRRRCGSALIGAALLLAFGSRPAQAVDSDPLPVPAGGPRARAIEHYNEGVVHLLARRFADAQQRFEQALALDESIAEAHNNLAYVLRMQGRQHFAASLAHYDRAIALKPTLAQAYAYRGVLFTQQGDLTRARQDLQRLRALDAKLAADLERVIEGRDAGAADRGSISGQYE